ncbi:MAG: hypothetical protein IT304_05280 [Dehalococcoidia bacterium]|nr:hypothetical protein [Dehalococcoidia bacterium]
MTARVAPTQSPPLGLIAPFFLAAPLGLVAAGLLLANAGHLSFQAINLPRNVAITHAVVLGWITTTMMGALYQMAPAVLSGRLWSERLARVQFVIHVLSVSFFVWSAWQWDVPLMGIAGSGIFVSLVLFMANAGVAVARARSRSVPRAAAALGLAWLAIAGGLGLTWVGTLEHLWFPITMGRLSAHAHVGLVGWLGITLMGLSYQLVPMFNVVTRVRPRFGTPVLIIMSLALTTFAAVVATDPGPAVRLPLALLLAVAPLLWGVDVVRLLLGRSKRRLDIQGHSMLVALVWLVLAVLLGAGAALGTPFTPGDESARWLLAYAAAGIGGWLGSALIGNSFKILPFLIWYHRYRPRVGLEAVPVVSDIYSERLATVALAGVSLAVATVAVSALVGSVPALQAGGALLVVGGLLHLVGLVHMFLPKHASRAPQPALSKRITV